MLSSLPPPPPGAAPAAPPTSGLAADLDIRLIGAERRTQTWLVLYVAALFGIVMIEAGTVLGALFIIGIGELVMSLWRATPKLPATSYSGSIGSEWQTPMRGLRLYLIIREFGTLAWGFLLATIFLGFFIIVARPASIGASNFIVFGLLVGYFGTRPLWYPAAKKQLGQLLKPVKKELAASGPQVRLVGDGIDVYQPVMQINGPQRGWLWHVAFQEIDELRALAALDAIAYWGTMEAYNPMLKLRAANELIQYMTGAIPRPSIYQYTAAGLHLLVRGPSVLYLLAYQDESGPAAITAWQQWRSAQAVPR